MLRPAMVLAVTLPFLPLTRARAGDWPTGGQGSAAREAQISLLLFLAKM